MSTANGDVHAGPTGLSDLLGRWQFSRWIDDRRAGQGVEAKGTADILPSPDGGIYDEAATLSLPGQAPIHATRRYLLRDGGDHLAFHFEDGRYFHRLDYGARAPHCHHACAPDNYAVQYDFAAWPEWSATWTVQGPRKDYVMTTRYTRAE